MKRIFIAVKIEPEDQLLEMISTFKSGLSQESINWTRIDNIHITMSFLGDTEEGAIQSIREILRVNCQWFGSFELILKGSGIFKNLNDPRVIWTGIESSAMFNGLNHVVISGLKSAGIKLEERPFSPHVTLGRIKYLKDKNALSSLLTKYKEAEIQRLPVNEIILYESILLQTGPLYKVIEKFKI